MRRVRRPLALPGVLLALALATSACIGMPTDGPVVPADAPERTDPAVSVVRQAQPPQEGDSPQSIVQGFLLAMRAYPVNLQTARSFLTTEEQSSWNPSRRIVTYAGSDERGTTSISVRLNDAHWIDARGAWRGELPEAQTKLRFGLLKENDEWRIASAPNAFFVPDDWFESYYRPASVYYYDPTARILVPQPVFVPDDQVASSLVRILLRGPGRQLSDIVRSFVPGGLTPGLSVPVDDGVAHINLDGDVGRLTPDESELMAAQFAWTLTQADITRFSLTIGNDPVSTGGSSTTFDVGDYGDFDPADQQASPLLYGVRNGNLEVGDPTAFQPVDGPLGTVGNIESVAVSLTATYAAAVTAGRTEIVRASVNDDQHPVEPVVTGATALGRPAWDFADRMWFVDQTPGGAVVSYLDPAPGSVPVAVPVRGVTGRQVRKLIVSRDGTRLVAVVRGQSRDLLRISRVRQDATGKVSGVTPSKAVSWTSGDTQRIRDIGWRTPTQIAVLHLLTPQVPQIVSVSVDGAARPQGRLQQAEPADSLVSSPGGQPLYTFTPSGLFGLESESADLPDGFTSVQYAG